MEYPKSVKINGIEYPITLPDLTTRRDIWVAVEASERRAHLAALGLCVDLPKYPSDPLLGPIGFKACKGSVYDFAARVEPNIERVELPMREVMTAAYICWLACMEGTIPTEVEAVSKVDFGSTEADQTGSLSISDSPMAGIPDGSTD